MKITKILSVALALLFFNCYPDAEVDLSGLKCEHRTNPLGIDSAPDEDTNPDLL